MKRRDFIFAAAAVASLGTAEALKPRRRLVLLRGTTIEASLPKQFEDWGSEATSGLVSPELSGSLTRALYSEIVPRLYFHDLEAKGVMLLAAYGDTQSDLLQLHRPEFCYPAVGFTLNLSQPATVPLGGKEVLPVRRVVAAREGRTENIVYWTRMGEDLPRSAGEQRLTRIRQSINGYVPDGILMRFSALGESEAAFATLDDFIPRFLKAIAPAPRQAYVGTRLAAALG
jgi:EpsI family protein